MAPYPSLDGFKYRWAGRGGRLSKLERKCFFIRKSLIRHPFLIKDDISQAVDLRRVSNAAQIVSNSIFF